MKTPIQKSTIVGTGLAAVTLYAGRVELASPPLHIVHASILTGLLLFSVALILGDDAFFATAGRFVTMATPLLPWVKNGGKGGGGAS